MKLKYTLSTIAVWTMLAAAVFGQAANGTPKLVIKSTEFNLGELKKGTPATHTFVFKNEGTVDLEIKRVAPS
ncbi:MAG: DUF1573 domain-containing protein [Blastocatellales bacterium]